MLRHLDDIGLLSFDNLAGYERIRLPKKLGIAYFGTPIIIEFPNEKDNHLNIGKVILSIVGQELALICGARPVPGFLDYVITRWLKEGLVLSSPYH